MYNKAIYKTHNGHYGNIMIFCFEQQSFSVEFCRPNWEKVSAKAFVLNSNGTIISINAIDMCVYDTYQNISLGFIVSFVGSVLFIFVDVL